MLNSKKIFRYAFLILTITFNGCSATGSYNSFKANRKILVGDGVREAFRYEGLERHPVIVIPGIFGSRLVDPGSKRTVWGLFTGKEMVENFSTKQIRLLSLPMEEGKRLSELRDAVLPAGVLETVKVRLLWLPIHVNGYKDMIDALEFAGYYGETSQKVAGKTHETCFTFAYDWRRDIVDTARQLDIFIQEKKKYLQKKYEELYGVKDYDVKFDIVAHSMGGLIARYYLRYGGEDLPQDGSRPALTWKGAKNIRKAVIVGTPNAGYLDAFTELVEGMIFAPGAPKIQPTALGTFPSLYEMMPLPSLGRVVSAKNGNEKVNLYDPKLWVKMKWGLTDPKQAKILEKILPDIKNAEKRREIAIDHLKKCLKRADQFTDAMRVDQAPPRGTTLHLFFGESILTNAVASLDEETGKIKVIKQFPGDGKVTANSALFNECSERDPWPFMKSPIHWSSVTILFAAHMGITKDPVFVSNMLYTLFLDDSERSVT
jgi:pimeloyl-ACP methyl ester carboxylesterase